MFYAGAHPECASECRLKSWLMCLLFLSCWKQMRSTMEFVSWIALVRLVRNPTGKSSRRNCTGISKKSSRDQPCEFILSGSLNWRHCSDWSLQTFVSLDTVQQNNNEGQSGENIAFSRGDPLDHLIIPRQGSLLLFCILTFFYLTYYPWCSVTMQLLQGSNDESPSFFSMCSLF